MRYEPGETLGHALDPRSKLAVQVGFAVAAFAHTTPTGLAVLSVVAALVLTAVRLSPLSVLRDVWVVLPLLLLAPIIEGVAFSPPWFDVAAARYPALAAYRVLLVLFVAAAYVRTTSSRESRAAVQRTVPGRVGHVAGVGVALVFRFVPVLVADLERTRAAMQARLGTERPLGERMRIVAIGGLNRAFARSNALSAAMQARCFAWNPTLPKLELGWRDGLALGLALSLAASAVAF